MVLKNVCFAIICTTLLAWCGGAGADEYRPGQFLGLDLSRAVLSPTPLGPATEFAPVAVEAKADRGSEGAAARAQHVTHPETRVAHFPAIHTAHLRSEKRRAFAHATVARRHGNPLDAQAFDARIQVWPCRSGGICNWKRPTN